MTLKSSLASAAATAETARLRSGTAARLAGLPVTTLRVWERRYGVVAARKQDNGQRLYSEADVQRLRLLRMLTLRGHAIGTIADLGLEALHGLAASPESETRHTLVEPPRVMVVGRGLARRLQASADCEVVAIRDDLALAGDGPSERVDLLIVQLGSLQPEAGRLVLALGARVQARELAVLYAFGAGAAADELRAAGVRVLRDPVSPADLSALLGAVAPVPGSARSASTADGSSDPLAVSPRRFSDDALGALAASPSSIACECLRHVVELVTQLGAFERYSADCMSLGPADAALHRHLSRTAGASRTLFEEALARMMDEHPAPDEGRDGPRSPVG